MTVAFRLSALCHIVALILWGIIPFFYEPFGTIYAIGIGLTAMALVLEHFLVLPRRNRPIDLQRINIAFFQLNILVSLGLFALGILDLLIR